MKEPKTKPPLNDAQLRALGHITAQSAALEHILDHLLFSIYLTGDGPGAAQEHAFESPPAQFKRRMKQIRDNLHKTYDEDLAAIISSATLKSIPLHKSRSLLVHGGYGEPDEGSNAEIKVIATKHFPLARFTIKTEEHTAASMEDLACDISELTMEIGQAMGEQAVRDSKRAFADKSQ